MEKDYVVVGDSRTLVIRTRDHLLIIKGNYLRISAISIRGWDIEKLLEKVKEQYGSITAEYVQEALASS